MTTSASELYKALPTFDANVSKWPAFYFKLRTHLEGRELLHIIDREDDPVVPAENDEQKKLRETQAQNRRRDDAKVRGIIVNKLSDDILPLVVDQPTAYKMVERLKSQYQSTSAASALSRLDKLLDLEFKTGQEISSHIGAVNGIINQIREAGGLDLDKLQVVVLLRSMPKTAEWAATISALKAQEESHLTIEKVARTLTEVATDSRSQSEGYSKRNERPSAAFQTGESEKKKIVCHNCGKKGHYKKDCWAKGGGAVGQAPKNKNNNSRTNHKDREGNYSFSVTDHTQEDVWIKDSGASKHYTNSMKGFQQFREINDQVTVADGKKITIKGVGSISFDARSSDGSVKRVTLNEVYYAPGLVANLLSTSVLDMKGMAENVKNGITRFMYDNTEIMCARRKGCRWIMDWEICVDKIANITNNSSGLWHKRLCHLSLDNMKRLESMVDGFTAKVEGKTPCDVCNQANQTRRPFKSSEAPKARYPMDLLHMDVIVINNDGIGGERNLLTITDDHSRCRFSFPIKSKSGSEILNEVMNWMPWAERMTNRKVKTIRHDNAKEFTHGVFAEKMKQLGIEQQTSIEYEHEQNGSAERTNRIILDKTRAILIDSGLDKVYWPYACLTATFVTNRSPAQGMNVTPIEAFTDIKPNLKNLRVFGSRCWAKIPNEKLKGRNKFEARARACKLLGYAQGGHAYTVVDETTKEIFTSTNVRFDEEESETHMKSAERNDSEKQSIDEYFSEDEDEEIDESSTQQDKEDENRNDIEPNVPKEQPIRRSSRIPKPVREYWKMDNRNPVHFAFLTYSQVKQEPDFDKWKEAMQEQIDTLKEYNTWELTELPKGRKAIKSGWVFQRKRNPDGSVGKYKARLVAKGYSQVEGVDFFDTFAPVAKPTTVKIILAIANSLGMVIHQGDVRAAYLNGKMDEDIYMEQPEGFEVLSEIGGAKLYCKLLQAIYGTKQAGRIWRKTLKRFLEKIGFKVSIMDPCLFIKGDIKDETIIMIVVWVDDLLTVYFKSNINQFNQFWKELSETFQVEDLGSISRYVGMQVTRDMESKVLTLDQSPAIKEVLMKFNMTNCNGRKTPLAQKQIIRKGEVITDKPYRALVGSLMHPVVWTRPDLAYAVGILGQFAHQPTDEHWNIGMEILKYVKSTMNTKLVYKGSDNFELKGYADSDWAADQETGRSIYGYIYYIGDCAISWKSKKSQTVATSTTMAEMEALYHATLEGLWIKGLLQSLGVWNQQAITIYQDNQAVIAIVTGEKNPERTKHEMVKIEFIRKEIAENNVRVEYKRSQEMVADIFTKNLGNNLFCNHKDSIGLKDC